MYFSLHVAALDPHYYLFAKRKGVVAGKHEGLEVKRLYFLFGLGFFSIYQAFFPLKS